MKMVFTLACIAAMICNFVQGQDTALAKIDKTARTIKKNATEIEAPVLNFGAVSIEKKSESTFKLPDYSGKHSILNNKVGPNGEELLMKKNKYYYIDGAGKKVKARRTYLTDKPKSS
jgi:hypothetical protein